MAIWTDWDYIGDVDQLQDYTWPWASTVSLPNGVGYWSQPGDSSHIGDYINRLQLSAWSQMWAANSLTVNHRLRNIEIKLEAKQGELYQGIYIYNPYSVSVYWAGASNTWRPPARENWPGTTYTTSLTLADWGLSTDLDGTTAMQQLLDDTFLPKIRPRNSYGTNPLQSCPGYITDIMARVEYDDPIPRVPGMLMGVV